MRIPMRSLEFFTQLDICGRQENSTQTRKYIMT